MSCTHVKQQLFVSVKSVYIQFQKALNCAKEDEKKNYAPKVCKINCFLCGEEKIASAFGSDLTLYQFVISKGLVSFFLELLKTTFFFIISKKKILIFMYKEREKIQSLRLKCCTSSDS